MLVFHMIPSNDPGVLPKILSVKEFVDSKLSVDFFQEERRRAAERKGGQSDIKDV